MYCLIGLTVLAVAFQIVPQSPGLADLSEEIGVFAEQLEEPAGENDKTAREHQLGASLARRAAKLRRYPCRFEL